MRVALPLLGPAPRDLFAASSAALGVDASDRAAPAACLGPGPLFLSRSSIDGVKTADAAGAAVHGPLRGTDVTDGGAGSELRTETRVRA
ncbi:hypothetical protein [Streptomyces sp. ADI96-02]|uniref:hypothetical protein n=1 Tax=Streptomyces sp. ADI96-02 TaxID=1522760 RepID=UPI000F5535B9|nr:hypothetical protein [Streptomyces sp. ADI96-02]